MEQRMPRHDLAALKALLDRPAFNPFTASALRGGLDLGLTVAEMKDVVRELPGRRSTSR